MGIKPACLSQILASFLPQGRRNIFASGLGMGQEKYVGFMAKSWEGKQLQICGGKAGKKFYSFTIRKIRVTDTCIGLGCCFTMPEIILLLLEMFMAILNKMMFLYYCVCTITAGRYYTMRNTTRKEKCNAFSKLFLH
jgi:hypothetical protein